MSHIASRWFLVVGAALISAPLVNAQDPTPVAYWSHNRQPQWGPPGVNAFSPPVPYCYYPPAYNCQAPQRYPVQGVQTPFYIPPGAGSPKPPHQHSGHLKNLFADHGRPVIDNLPTHPYARSPRDFFMFYENLEAERSRELRPSLIP